MLEDLLLISGNDIPFYSARVTIKQPTIKEIAYVGEENFFSACRLLDFSRDMLNEEDKKNLANTDDFDILMSIIFDESAVKYRLSVTMLLSLMFPEYTIKIRPEGIFLDKDGEQFVINKDNYPEFKEILQAMFMIREEKKEEFNPKNEAARKIAEKIQRGREKVAQLKGEKTKKFAIFSRYVSILAIGLQLDINVLLNHTVYQIYDELKRFQMKQAFDINLQARMAGATDLEDVENWMNDIHL